MKYSFLIVAASLAGSVVAFPKGFSFNTSSIAAPDRGKYVSVKPITTVYQYLCPTGLAESTTTITELPSTNTAVDSTIPGWSEYVTVCTACEDKTKRVTLTLPPDVAPTGPTAASSGVRIPTGTGITHQPPAGLPPAASSGVRIPTGTGIAHQPPAGLPSAASSSDISSEVSTISPSLIPVVSAPSAIGNEEVSTTVVKTTYVDLCPTGFTTRSTEVTKQIPVTASHTELTISMTETVTVCTVCGEKPTTVTLTRPAETPAASVPATITSGTSTIAATSTTLVPIVSVPVPTQGEDLHTTVINTTFIDLCPTGFTTRSTEVTKEIPATATLSHFTISMTEVVTICTVCGAKPTSVTITRPAETPVTVTTSARSSEVAASSSITQAIVPAPTPTGDEEVTTAVIKTTYVDVCSTGLTTRSTQVTKTIPVTISTKSLSFSMTVIHSACTKGCGPSPTTVMVTIPAQSTVTKPAQTGSTTYVPIVSAPAAVSGEDVTTTIVKTTYVDVCPTGLTTKTTQVTKTIPATATNTVTFDMTETTKLCTACGSNSTSVVVTVPALQPTTTEATATTASSVSQSTKAIVVTTHLPIVYAPVPTEGEDVTTIIVKTSYVDVCPTGLTTRITQVIKTIPATATGSSLTFVMTETTKLCTACGPKPTSIVVTAPVVDSTTIDQTTTGLIPIAKTVELTETDSLGEITTLTSTLIATLAPIPSPTEAKTITRTAIGPNGSQQQETIVSMPGYQPITQATHNITNTVCRQCSESGGTVTLTLPLMTSALTLTPTSVVTFPSGPLHPTASVSGGLLAHVNGTGNGTRNGTARFVTPPFSPLESKNEAGRVRIGMAGIVGVVVAGLLIV